ncbi:uncharacterized protein K452DRAFT_328943 [Aplosporella prunicola CBS 121167]|uniref:Small nuclear ribonucleoprotein Prp3 C-terminal domain-containing protein n=1 Tax=Aplosporella prunicola CBS 121167 TaxID=1176127 RepID=A0A6A6B1S5_9PEZI|nr:uncharacterized protein K452DRAFT_328943 [Aplosporella prunicola CBS 121167]KAF2138000.1 hypothetical protein K452DRAFT_328943 [Aplosporella prunicola CBS 121167]
MAAAPPSHLLPRDALEAQLATMDLFAAMFPAPGELELSDETEQAAARLRAWCDSADLDTSSDATHPPGVAHPPGTPAELAFASEARTIRMDVTVPLRSTEADATEPPALRWALRQPHWLARAEHTALGQAVAEEAGDDVFGAVEAVRAHGAAAAKAANGEATEGGGGDASARAELVRAWFYFPSLSTRAKRLDLVTTAPSYALTGFVLAGKPGVLCLEGRAGDIDAYMRYIKAVSWSDIPSHQKKVSERWREAPVLQRAFADMAEITDALGERHGERANRGDMKALEAWLGERGVGEAFARVVLS